MTAPRLVGLRDWTDDDAEVSCRVAPAGFTPLPGAPTTREIDGGPRPVAWYGRPA